MGNDTCDGLSSIQELDVNMLRSIGPVARELSTSSSHTSASIRLPLAIISPILRLLSFGSQPAEGQRRPVTTLLSEY